MKATKLLVLFLFGISLNAFAFDFSAVAPTGQTLYYNIRGSNVIITRPSINWSGYSKPAGNLTIPSSVVSNGVSYNVVAIDFFAFGYCSNLTSVSIPNTVTKLDSRAFAYCSSLTTITIPTSVDTIGGAVFDDCSSLTTVFFNATTCAYMGNSSTPVFNHCTSLTTVNLGNNVQIIPPYAFWGCGSLSSITIPNSVNSIGEYSFFNCSGLTSINIPNSITSIGDHAFNGCSSLYSFNIPSSITSIGNNTFSNCDSLTTISIPNSVTSIGNFSFSNCHSLTSITIPNSVTSIGNLSFRNCSSLTSIIIPNSVTSIGTNPFSGCSNILSMIVASGNTQYDSRNNCNAIINSSNNTLISGCINTVIPNTVISIGSHAFSIGGVTSISMPNSITSIGDDAFSSCHDLATIVWGSNITNIGARAFSYCHGLTSVDIPQSVTSIGIWAFDACTNLTTVNLYASNCLMGNVNPSIFSNCPNFTTLNIGENVISLPYNAFTNCNNLTEIHSHATIAPNISSNTFSGVPSTVSVYIPCGSLSSYTSRWTCFSNISEMPNIEYSVSSSDNIMGSVSVLSLPTCDSSVITAYAQANNGYRFSHWSNGSTINPNVFFLSGNDVIIAYFVSNQHTITIQSDNENNGIVTGSGVYDYLDTITIRATGINHHHFVRWSDGNTDNPRQYVVTGDATLTAFFAIDTHSVSVVSNDIARGMATSTGTEFVYGTPCTVTATAYTGYMFSRWSNGITANPYTFAVLEDTELMAIFEEEGTQWIDDVATTDNIRIFSKYDRILIDGLNGQDVTIYTIDGRAIASLPKATEHVAIPVTNTGVYIVKIGNHPARKVVVIR